MRITKTVEGTPIYVCESPAVKYRENWHGQLYKEMSLFFESLHEEILLRGSHETNLDMIAQKGTDDPRSELIYVVPYQLIYSIYYPFGRATTAILFYRASGLVERIGDRECMGVDHNRYQFIVPPKIALLGVIDLREVHRKSKRLGSLYRQIER